MANERIIRDIQSKLRGVATDLNNRDLVVFISGPDIRELQRLVNEIDELIRAYKEYHT